MDSMRKIFTGLDFGGRRIKNVKIDDQPYYVPFVFSDDNANTPVPQEIVDELNHRIDYAIEKGTVCVVAISINSDVTIPQIGIVHRNDDLSLTITAILDYYNINHSNELHPIESSRYAIGIFVEINNTWGYIQKISLEAEANSDIYIIDGDNFTEDIFNEIDDYILNRKSKFYILKKDGLLISVDNTGYSPHSYITFEAISSMKSSQGLEIVCATATLRNSGITFEPTIISVVLNGDGTKFLSDDGTYKEVKSGTSFYTLDLNSYTPDTFSELSAMILGTTIQVIDKSGRPGLYQIADHEPEYVTINSYMRYDDDDEDPEIVSYTLRADGTVGNPYVRITLETMGGGDRFLSDLGWYKEIKIPELINAKVTQAEYDALEAAGTLDANTIYYIIG